MKSGKARSSEHQEPSEHSFPIDHMLETVAAQVQSFGIPSVTKLAAAGRDPFLVLVSTVLSSRTKDETTLAATERLFSRISSPSELARLNEEELEKLIFPVGFYHTKAKNLKKLGQMLDNSFHGKVPVTMDDLLTLPGVGRKTANLVLSLAFAIDAICVDTHVHRITNRWGYVSTSTPAETEKALRNILPRQWWIIINTVLVAFGQNICRPQSPRCSQCLAAQWCSRINVHRSR